MTESQAKNDLAIRHYPGKWKQALGMAEREVTHRKQGEDYWAHVRRTYLELGGLFVGHLDPIQQITYHVSLVVLQ